MFATVSCIMDGSPGPLLRNKPSYSVGKKQILSFTLQVTNVQVYVELQTLAQGFSKKILGDPNFRVKILCDPKQTKIMLVEHQSILKFGVILDPELIDSAI